MIKILFPGIFYLGISFPVWSQGIPDSLSERTDKDKLDTILQKIDTYSNKATPPVSSYVHGKISKAGDSMTKIKNKPARRIKDTIALIKKQAKANKAAQKALRTKAKIDRKSQKLRGMASKAGVNKIPAANGIPSLNSKPGDKINLDNSTQSLTKSIHETADKGLSKAAQPLPMKDIQNAKQQVGEVQGAAKQLNALRKGNADSIADQMAAKVNLGGKAEDIQAKLAAGDMTASPEVLSQLKTQAVNHFVGKEAEIMAVLTGLSDKRSKVLNNGGWIDMMDKKINSQKSLPWYQRTFAGVTLQLQKITSWNLDVNPFVTYHLTNRWQAGAGWNERIAYNFNNKEWASKDRVYGPRSEICFWLNTYAALCGQVELMNSSHRNNGNSRRWTWGYFGGLRTHIQLPKRWGIYGYLLFQINSNPNYNPYAHPLALRFAIVREGLKKGD